MTRINQFAGNAITDKASPLVLFLRQESVCLFDKNSPARVVQYRQGPWGLSALSAIF
jgi:hypothetical protein